MAGRTYALYRVTGAFKAQFNSRQFPFDKEELPIVIQHKTLPAAALSYVPDESLLEQSQAQRLESGVDAVRPSMPSPNGRPLT